jgi:hypothetical protein
MANTQQRKKEREKGQTYQRGEKRGLEAKTSPRWMECRSANKLRKSNHERHGMVFINGSRKTLVNNIK